jgi:hypothetical protein
MSIIQQLVELDNKANKYNNQRTLHLYAEHPRAGDKDNEPLKSIRIDYDTSSDKSNAKWLLDFLKKHGICATLYHSSAVDGVIRNFEYLPRKKMEGEI